MNLITSTALNPGSCMFMYLCMPLIGWTFVFINLDLFISTLCLLHVLKFTFSCGSQSIQVIKLLKICHFGSKSVKFSTNCKKQKQKKT